MVAPVQWGSLGLEQLALPMGVLENMGALCPGSISVSPWLWEGTSPLAVIFRGELPGTVTTRCWCLGAGSRQGWGCPAAARGVRIPPAPWTGSGEE